MNRNFHKIILLIIIVCVFLVVLAFISSNQNKSNIENNENNVDIKNELEKLKQDNLENFKDLDMSEESRLNPITTNDHIIGDLTENSVQVVIYSSFDCPFCTDLNDIINYAKKDFEGKDVVFAYRHYVMRSQSSAMDAAIASECADDQGKYWDMHEKLFELNKADNLNISTIKEAATELELDLIEFNKCLAQMKHKDDILLEMLSAKNAGVNGTPTIFVDKVIYPGAIPYEDYTDDQGDERMGLKSIIESKL